MTAETSFELAVAGRKTELIPGTRGRFVGWTLLMLTLLLWPLLVFGRPAYFPDSLSYYKGGQAAIAFVHSKVSPPSAGAGAGKPQSRELPREVQEARGARSIAYSILTFIFAAPGVTLAGLALLQAALLATILSLTWPILGFTSRVQATAFSAVIAFGTPAAWYACFAMPDILAGVAILALALLVGAHRRMAASAKIWCGLVAALSLASHPSHLAIGLILAGLAFGAAAWAWLRTRSAAVFRGSIYCASAVLLGVLIVLGSGYIGFHEVSLAPKRYPLTLARSIEDGPARWYLERSCTVKHYEICKIYNNRIPARSFDLLWGPQGLSRIGTPQQIERIRLEEPEILLAAARAYPSQQAAAAVGGTVTQILQFGLGEASFANRIVHASNGELQFEAVGEPHAWIRRWLDRASLSLVVLSVLILIGRLRRRSENLPVISAILIGLAANAAVCAIFSASAARYQARVIWLLPICAAASLRRRRDDQEAPSNETSHPIDAAAQ